MGAKARLFEMLNQSARKPGTPKAAVINADDRRTPGCGAYRPTCNSCTGWTASGSPILRPDDLEYRAGGTRFTAQTPAADIP